MMKSELRARYQELAVVGRGYALSGEARTLPKVVRYADESAWLAAEAVAAALRQTSDVVDGRRGETGVIAMSSTGPRETLARVGADSRGQLVSPLRYPSANPATLAGLPCIACGLTGPSLNLTMPPIRGVGVAVSVAQAWLRRELALVVALVTCELETDRMYVARCLLLAPAAMFVGYPEELRTDLLWIENR